MLTKAQLLERVNYIGTSDAAAVLGLSRWKTPLALWSEKTGNVVPKDISDHLPVRLGNKLEQTVAELFTEETGLKVRRVNETVYHPEHPFLAANIDRKIVGESWFLECKTCSPFKYKEWEGDEIPTEYVIQVMHGLAVTGHKRAYLAVLIGNTDFKVKIVERDDALIRDMVMKEVHFWKTYVEPKVMPMIITANDADTLYDLFPMQTTGSEVSFGDDMDQLIEARSSMLADLKSLQTQIEQHENEIKARLQTAETAKTARHVITWKAQSRKSVDAKKLEAEHPTIYVKMLKESSSRVLRIKQVGEAK